MPWSFWTQTKRRHGAPPSVEGSEAPDAPRAVADPIRGLMADLGQKAIALADASEGLSTLSYEMSSTAERTSSQAGSVSENAGQVSRNIESVAVAVEQMSASILEISKNTELAAHISEAVSGETQAATATMGKLGVSSAEIGQVVQVIEMIARQTNLLALNATIEAARAGDSGRGFAVVANEVKELARNTASATGDIARKIQTIQNETGAAVRAIGQVGETIRQIHEISGLIATAIEEQRATTAEISRSLTEAAHASAEISDGIQHVAEGAHETAAASGSTQRAAGELARMAAELRRVAWRPKAAQAGGSEAPASGLTPGATRPADPFADMEAA